MNIATDYLVVGAGAAGMAFTDALLTHSDATVTIVDRRHPRRATGFRTHEALRRSGRKELGCVAGAKLLSDGGGMGVDEDGCFGSAAVITLLLRRWILSGQMQLQ